MIKIINIVNFVHCLLTTLCNESEFPPANQGCSAIYRDPPPTRLLPPIVLEGFAGVGKGEFVLMIKIDAFVGQ